MQTAGKGSNSTGCHSGVPHLCRNACSEQNNTCTNSYLFSKDECHSFLEICIILQKFCYPVEQMLHSHSCLAQPRQPACPALPSPLCCLRSASRSMDVYIHLHLTVSPSQMSFICHFGCHTLGLICLHSLNSHCSNSQGVIKKIVGSKHCWENVKAWQPTERGCWLKKDLESLK